MADNDTTSGTAPAAPSAPSPAQTSKDTAKAAAAVQTPSPPADEPDPEPEQTPVQKLTRMIIEHFHNSPLSRDQLIWEALNTAAPGLAAKILGG